MKRPAPKPASEAEIRRILGPVDDEVVIDILRTGATTNEVQRAYTWLYGNNDIDIEAMRALDERARNVYEILENDRDQYAREDR